MATQARSAAHPRACGENDALTARYMRGDGSSPRVRGKLDSGVHHSSPQGLIPARAGKTGAGVPAGGRSRAHPRVCGENGCSSRVAPSHIGSSPRVRGKLAQCGGDVDVGRLIPACAGKTCQVSTRRRTGRAHPRVCGENGPRSPLRARLLGSSPRVRGKRGSWSTSRCQVRLIPARAGKTRPTACRRCRCRAHPRACGENMGAWTYVIQPVGSSPRVRGKPLFVNGFHLSFGLIPARAGKTRQVSEPRTPSSAHPRACGENKP